jgi:exonuclease III
VNSQGSGGGVRRGLRVLQWNVDGIGTAIADVITLVREDPGLDVLLLQETKLIPVNPTPTLPGYSAIRHDHPPNPGGQGGGFLIYVKADIPFRQIPAYREEEIVDGLEVHAVEIQRGARGKFVITNLYMPPSGRAGWF